MNGCRILVIDNEPGALEVINNILLSSCQDVDVMNASNGKIGFDIITQEVPDMIISDWDMPEMNGLQLIRKIQSDKKLRYIPIIVCTGIMMDARHLKEALDAGAVDYIRKPVNEIELISRVKSMWRLIKLREELLKEQEEHNQTKILHLEEKVNQQTVEIKSRALTLGRFNNLLKSISKELRQMNHKIQIETNNLQIDDLVSQIDTNITNVNWSEFQAGFEELYPDFIHRLRGQFPDLTKNDLRLCILTKLNLSTKEMAALLNQSIRSVEMARHRLRQKIGLEREDNLNGFLESI